MMETDYENLIRCISEDLEQETHVRFRMGDLKVVKDEVARLKKKLLDSIKMQNHYVHDRNRYRDANHELSDEVARLKAEIDNSELKFHEEAGDAWNELRKENARLEQKFQKIRDVFQHFSFCYLFDNNGYIDDPIPAKRVRELENEILSIVNSDSPAPIGHPDAASTAPDREVLRKHGKAEEPVKNSKFARKDDDEE